MGIEDEVLVEKICEMYEKISRLESLKPSQEVNMLFTQLVVMCIPPASIDVSKLPQKVQHIRSELIRLSGEAEGHLESHYSTILGSHHSPLDHLTIFPYYSNYLKLSLREFTILSRHFTRVPARVAFVGSGPLPLTSIVLASHHLTTTTFHNYDLDPSANSLAARLLSSSPDLSTRMLFHTTDIMNVTDELRDYEVVFLAALVGMGKKEKLGVIKHLLQHMAPGALLMLRSAKGARAFLYPVVEPCDLHGFELLSVYHPTDDVINSVVVARKPPLHVHSLVLPCKCSEMQAFNPFNHLSMIED